MGTVIFLRSTPWQPISSVQPFTLQGLSLLAYCKGLMSLPSQGPAPVSVWGPGFAGASNRTKLHTGATFPPWNCPSSMVTIIVTLAKLHPIVTEAGHLCVSLYFLYLDLFPLELLGQRRGREVQGTG